MVTFPEHLKRSGEPEARGEPRKEEKGSETRERIFPTSTPEETILSSRDIVSKEILKGGRRESTQFVSLKDDGDGIWHEGSGWPHSPKKERAAYIVDRFLGFDFVPPTVVRVINGEEGSLQQFVRDAKTGSEIDWKDFSHISIEEIVKLMLFDFLITNMDRHRGNYLMTKDKIIAIDNSQSFERRWLDKSGFREKVFGVSIPQKLRDSILSFTQWQEGANVLRGLLSELLTEAETANFFRRLEGVVQMAKNGLFFTQEELDKF